MRKLIIILIFIVSYPYLSGQELKCNVQIVSQNVQGTNKQVFETLQNAVYEFMNNRVWTNHVYSVEERIECNLMFNITEQISADEFKGTLQLQVRRPVFNTNYNTVLLNFIDNDIHFRYVEFSPLEFDPNSHYTNLTSILGFYAYFILGLDYDSFSLMGGGPYFELAEKVVENAQNAAEKGWKPMDNLAHKSRYWLVKDFLDPDYQPVREFNYRYHRKGLDVMDEEVADGRAEIAGALELLQDVFRSRPDNYMYTLRLVFDSKVDELVNIFSESFPEEKNRVHAILIEVDQTNKSKYQSILEAPN